MSKTVAWIDDNMTSKELTEWQAFYEYVEPFGGKFLDMQFASLRMQNYGGEEKLGLEDFMLYDYRLLTPQQKEQIKTNKAKAKAQKQAAELRAFFASKVSK
ncbi:phage tail assembly protein T [Psychrobacter celer]|uniref:phage tail assembly protein T n=1 Tax=Psychrobacter celer TaxID=306572 RepID=UPI003FD5A0A9